MLRGYMRKKIGIAYWLSYIFCGNGIVEFSNSNAFTSFYFLLN